MRVDGSLQQAVRALKRRGFATPWLDAEVLLGHVLGVDRSHLAAHPEQPLTRARSRRFLSLVRQRVRGQPVAYLLGRKEFYGRWFAVTPAVMIPRPETETIVEIVGRHQPAHRAGCRIADIGTGCGNVAITLARELPRAMVHAVDISRRALRIAKNNAKRLDASVQFHPGNLLQPLRRAHLDIVVANLPYLDRTKYQRTGSLRFEPSRALWSPDHGLAHYRRLLQQLSQRHQLPSLTCCEMNPEQTPLFRVVAQQLVPRLAYRKTIVNRVAFVTLTTSRPNRK